MRKTPLFLTRQRCCVVVVHASLIERFDPDVCIRRFALLVFGLNAKRLWIFCRIPSYIVFCATAIHHRQQPLPLSAFGKSSRFLLVTLHITKTVQHFSELFVWLLIERGDKPSVYKHAFGCHRRKLIIFSVMRAFLLRDLFFVVLCACSMCVHFWMLHETLSLSCSVIGTEMRIIIGAATFEFVEFS